MVNQKPPVIFLMGPTASGKSALAYALADTLPVEIISVDATQVYRGLDIGSAKPSAAEQARIVHHLIDIRDPADPYSAADFRTDALAAIENISGRDKIPLLVGGTMLYFKVLLEGLADLPDADPEIRAAIAREAEALGWPAMHQKLAQVDPITAERLHPNHSQRIARALEIFRITGRPMSELHREQAADANLQADYNVYQLALSGSREHLHQAIDQRFEHMLAQGLEAEVRDLQQRADLNLDLPAIRAVGYRQMWCYLQGEYDYQTMTAKAKAATRQLAKRQITWLRAWNNLCVLSTQEVDGAPRKIEKIRDQALNQIVLGTI